MVAPFSGLLVLFLRSLERPLLARCVGRSAPLSLGDARSWRAKANPRERSAPRPRNAQRDDTRERAAIKMCLPIRKDYKQPLIRRRYDQYRRFVGDYPDL
jgi:hypothetical protein